MWNTQIPAKGEPLCVVSVSHPACSDDEARNVGACLRICVSGVLKVGCIRIGQRIAEIQLHELIKPVVAKDVSVNTQED